MKILILTQYFYPEINAPAHRHKFFANFLAEAGNEVTVICETPNYPKGEVFKGYKNELFQREKTGNFEVIRSWVWVTLKKDFINRILNYFSFFFSSILAAIFKAGKVDVIFASSPPLFVIFAGYIISKIKGAPLVVDIRDIWPDSAFEVGMLKKNFIFRIVEGIEKYVYKKSARVVVNAKGLKKRLIRDKGVLENKIEILTNGAELDFFKPGIDFSELNKRYKLENKFVVLYTGLIGLAQAPEVMIEAARALKSQKDILFLIVGEGVLKKKCEELAKSYKLENIIFTGERPRSEMPMFAARADMAIIPYKNSELFKDVIPSKMFDYMAAEVPVVINLDGEGAQIIREAGCGFVVEPDNYESLVEIIIRIYENREEAMKMGKKGREFVEKYYSREKIAKELTNLLNSVIF